MTFLNVDGTAVVYGDEEKVIIGARVLAVTTELLIAFLESVPPDSHRSAVAGPDDDIVALTREKFIGK